MCPVLKLARNLVMTFKYHLSYIFRDVQLKKMSKSWNKTLTQPTSSLTALFYGLSLFHRNCFDLRLSEILHVMTSSAISSVIITINRLSGYILGKIGTWTKGKIQEKVQIDVNRFCRDVNNRSWRLANEITNVSAQTTADAIADTISL